MRKILWLTILAVVPALGCECETLRRIEVWKQQNLFGVPHNVVAAPPGGVCGGPAPAAECGCGIAAEPSCSQGAAVPAVTSYGPEMDGPVVNEPADNIMPGPVLTEESDGVLKQP
ncbi:MAG TPA: hypothetical protein VGJ15_11650 [Pirellulales bacterium]|jgi:hypothetical protein